MKYSSELAEALCEQLATSLQTLDQVCRQFNITRMTIWRWRHSHPEFERMYAEARMCQREILYDLMLETMQQPAFDNLDLRMKKLQIDVCKTILTRDIKPVEPLQPSKNDDYDPEVGGSLTDEQFKQLLWHVNEKNKAAAQNTAMLPGTEASYQPPRHTAPPPY